MVSIPQLKAPARAVDKRSRLLIPLVVGLLLAGLAWLFSSIAGRLFGFAVTRSDLAAPVAMTALVAAIGRLIYFLFKRSAGTRSKVALGAALILIVGSGISGLTSYLRTPTYVVQRISSDVVVWDTEGRTGQVRGHFEIKVLHTRVSEIWWSGLEASGKIHNLFFESPQAQNSELYPEKGQAALNFGTPLRRGELVDIFTGFDVIDSPPEDKVYWRQRVYEGTRLLQITVAVPRRRPCRSAEAQSVPINGRKEMHNETVPFLTEENSRLTWTKENPEPKKEYTVVCHW